MLRPVQFFRERWYFAHSELWVGFFGWVSFVCCVLRSGFFSSFNLSKQTTGVSSHLYACSHSEEEHMFVLVHLKQNSYLLRAPAALKRVLLMALQLLFWGHSSSCSSWPGSGISSFIWHPSCSTPAMFFSSSC